jgi:hypothetical protein
VDEAFQASAPREGYARSGTMDHSSTLPQHPSSQNRTAWADYWQEQGQPWRTEPEIDEERQQYLVKLRAIAPDIEKGIYPFKRVGNNVGIESAM